MKFINRNGECILQISEGENLELKRAKKGFPRDAWESYSAFANTEGGVIMLGFEELSSKEFKLTGVDDPNKIQSDFYNSLHNHEIVSVNVINKDAVSCINVDGKTFITIEVPKASYNQKPVYLSGNPANSYKRVGPNDYKLSESEIRNMMRDSSPMSQDSTIIDDTVIHDAFDQKTIEAYRNRLITRRPDLSFNSLGNEDFLVKIRAAQEVNSKIYPTLAGLLMFGKTNVIHSHLPYYFLEYINYQGNQDRWADRVVYDGTWGEGNLFNFYLTALPKLLNTAQNHFGLATDGVIRQEYSDIQIALREAFINSLIHADYRMEDRIQIRCENKKYTFSNPGTLRITVKEFYEGKTSSPRNPAIAFMFRMAGLAEEAGSGVPAMLKAAESNQLPRPEISSNNSVVQLIINTIPLLDLLSSKYNLNDREYNVLKAIYSLTYARRTDIEKATNLSRGIVLECVKNLAEKNVITQIGKSSSTKYTISEEFIPAKEKTIDVLRKAIYLIQKQ